jgi:hypothetical protein
MIVHGKPAEWQTQARRDDMIFTRAAGVPLSNLVRNARTTAEDDDARTCRRRLQRKLVRRQAHHQEHGVCRVEVELILPG